MNRFGHLRSCFVFLYDWTFVLVFEIKEILANKTNCAEDTWHSETALHWLNNNYKVSMFFSIKLLCKHTTTSSVYLSQTAGYLQRNSDEYWYLTLSGFFVYNDKQEKISGYSHSSAQKFTFGEKSTMLKKSWFSKQTVETSQICVGYYLGYYTWNKQDLVVNILLARKSKDFFGDPFCRQDHSNLASYDSQINSDQWVWGFLKMWAIVRSTPP